MLMVQCGLSNYKDDLQKEKVMWAGIIARKCLKKVEPENKRYLGQLGLECSVRDYTQGIEWIQELGCKWDAHVFGERKAEKLPQIVLVHLYYILI